MSEVITAHDDEEWADFWRCPVCGERVAPLLRVVDLDTDRPERCGACVRENLGLDGQEPRTVR